MGLGGLWDVNSAAPRPFFLGGGGWDGPAVESERAAREGLSPPPVYAEMARAKGGDCKKAWKRHWQNHLGQRKSLSFAKRPAPQGCPLARPHPPPFPPSIPRPHTNPPKPLSIPCHHLAAALKPSNPTKPSHSTAHKPQPNEPAPPTRAQHLQGARAAVGAVVARRRRRHLGGGERGRGRVWSLGFGV